MRIIGLNPQNCFYSMLHAFGSIIHGFNWNMEHKRNQAWTNILLKHQLTNWNLEITDPNGTQPTELQVKSSQPQWTSWVLCISTLFTSSGTPLDKHSFWILNSLKQPSPSMHCWKPTFQFFIPITLFWKSLLFLNLVHFPSTFNHIFATTFSNKSRTHPLSHILITSISRSDSKLIELYDGQTL